jgi:hypothetical protein
MHTAIAVQDHSLIVFGGVSRKEAFGSADDLEASMNLQKVALNQQTFRVSVKPPKVANWHAVTLSGDAPTARATHRAVNVQGSMYVFGAQSKKCNNVYVYNIAFTQWRRLKVSGTKPRPTSGGSLARASNTLVVFGGETDRGICNDLHVLDLSTSHWSQITPSGPLIDGAKTAAEVREKLMPRRDHSAVAVDERLLVFGGFGVTSEHLEFIEFDAQRRQWAKVDEVGDKPKKRGAHCCAMYETYMIIFGGQRHGKFLNDLHVFNTDTGVWTAVAILATPSSFIPTPRAFAASSLIGDTWYVHGGGDDEHIFSDFFKVDARTIARCSDPNLPADGERQPVVVSTVWNELVEKAGPDDIAR